ncbi:signal peptide peptidase SppA [Polycyclovorans algicola]|uniref:signal peptide peptidase SppA n=1 Tax=Polycyclovorans algicola TaxID=616992 RepID=UPI0004A714A1|nr:signal peptide peptidase SppA [Polycyclovorans algicola]
MANADQASKSWLRRLFDGLWTVVSTLYKTLIMLGLVLFLVSLWFIWRGPGLSTQVEDNVALIVAPSGALVDRIDIDPRWALFDQLAGAPPPQTAMRDVITAFERGAEGSRINFAVLKLDDVTSLGLAQGAELIQAIEQFRATGKTVVAYSAWYDQASYLPASHADEIVIDPMGMLAIEGLSSYSNFVKGLTDKLGVNVNVFRVGEFKSAVEPFIRQDMSDEAKVANRAWLESLWGRYGVNVAEGRDLQDDAVHQFVETLPARMEAEGGQAAEIALRAGLVTHVETLHAFRARMKERVGEDAEHGSFRQIHFQQYLAATESQRQADLSAGTPPGVIARVVVQGEIVNGQGDVGVSGGDAVEDLLMAAQLDESVRAVLLRVDSPGGSVWASEQMRRGVEQLKAAGKPVVVSMGNVAASGGYWISMNADRIFALPESITGSIGIFGLLPTFENSLEKIGVSTDGVGTTSMAGAFRLDRPLGDSAKRVIQAEIERGYDDFINKVAEARGQTPEAIDSVAQGRVWSGEAALDKGLIDAFGTEADAVAELASLAGLDDWELVEWTDVRDLFQLLFDQFFGGLTGMVRASLIPQSWLQLWAPVERATTPLLRLSDPRGQYAHCECGVAISTRSGY